MTTIKQEPNQQIYIYHTGVASDILGPGNRLVVWTSGCPFNCKGCIEPGLHDIRAGELWPVEVFLGQIRELLGSLKQITFSGGEPLYQADQLLILLSALPPDTDILLFTGYELAEATRLYPLQIAKVDILIAGPYLEERAGNYLWRGSENQTISSPSHKYSEAQLDIWLQSPSAGLEIYTREDRLFIYGVPPKDMMTKLSHQLKDRGIHIHN